MLLFQIWLGREHGTHSRWKALHLSTRCKMFPSCTLSLVPARAFISAAKPPDRVRWLCGGKWLFTERMSVHDKTPVCASMFKKKNPIPFFSQIHRPSTFAGQLMTLMCASPSPAIFCKWQMPALSQKMYLFICFCQMNSARGWNLFSSFSFSFLQWYEQMDLPERCCTLLMLKCWIYFTLTSAAPVNTTAVTESVQNYYNCSWYEN